MPAHYAALPNPLSVPDAERELDDAFESDNDDDGVEDHESTPLTHRSQPPSSHAHEVSLYAEPTSFIPGAYDFERDYDYPPPGSPPRPSAFALPNDIGNSNGQMPTSPVRVSMPQPSIFRRAVGAILPTHYVQVPTEAQSSRTRGGGIENDGVFANVMAKPQRARVIHTEDGDIRLVPEDAQKEAPPSYADAQADAVPPYWETTVHAPAGFDAGLDMVIDDLPSGSIWVFGLNVFISFFFQFVGFLLTYLLHTSHAAKFGSRAGLGLTLIQYGFYSRAIPNDAATGGDAGEVTGWPITPTDSSDPLAATSPTDGTQSPMSGVTTRDWLSFLLMTLGWFLLLSSIIGFWRIKRWENSIRASANPAPRTPEDIEQDIAIRRNIQNIFGIGLDEERETATEETHRVRRDENGSVIVIPAQEMLEEARLARDLRAAGLL